MRIQNALSNVAGNVCLALRPGHPTHFEQSAPGPWARQAEPPARAPPPRTELLRAALR